MHPRDQSAHLRDQLCAVGASGGVLGKRQGFGGAQCSVEIVAQSLSRSSVFVQFQFIWLRAGLCRAHSHFIKDSCQFDSSPIDS